MYYQSLCIVVKCSSVCISLFSSLSSFVSQAGDNSVGLSDLNLEDKLCVYINGGAKSFVRLKTNTTFLRCLWHFSTRSQLGQRKD